MTLLTRRNFLATAAAGAALAALPGRSFAAQTFAIGDGELITLSDGTFAFPPDLWIGASEEEKELLDNPQVIGANAYVLRRGDRVFLIDSGAGNSPFITTQFDTVGRVPAEMSDAGIAAGDITDIVITHMHPDHVGGVVRDGAPAFPNATIHVDRAKWDFWMRDGFVGEAPEQLRPMVAAVQETGALVQDQVAHQGGDVDLGMGVASLKAYGHTPGHNTFLLDLGNEQVLVLGDTVVSDHIHFAHPHVGWALDLDPEAAAATRRRLLDMAATDGLVVAGNHVTAPGLGRVERDGDAFRFVPL